jgi:hypothetical protein
LREPQYCRDKKAHVDTIDGGRPDIEAQWWGGAAQRFRIALYQLKLKTNRIRERGGWECYITNVIKQSNIAKDQGDLKTVDKKQQARDWSDILNWELETVKPKFVFCVGGNSYNYVLMLQKEGLLRQFPIYEVMHYSARAKETEVIINEIIADVRNVIEA